MSSGPDRQDLRLAQQAGMELLARWDDVCAQYGLTYHLAAGTLLGCVREGGFIAWDDDVDVTMPRTDFERLAAINHRLPDLFGPDCDYLDGSRVDGIGRLRLLSSVCTQGHVQLDVFTIDAVPDRRLLRVLLVRLAWSLRVAGPARTRPAMMALFGAFLRCMDRHSSGRWVNCMNGARPMGRERPAAWYHGHRTGRFGRRYFPIPMQAERILALRYGADFQTPTRYPDSTHYSDVRLRAF